MQTGHLIKPAEFTVDTIRSGVFMTDLPELYLLRTVQETNAWHDHDVVFEHTMNVADKALAIINGCERLNSYFKKNTGSCLRKQAFFIAAVFHDIAKPATINTVDGETSCPRHETVGADMMKDILARFDLNRTEKNYITDIVRHHGDLHGILMERSTAMGNLIKFRDQHPDDYIELLVLNFADTMGAQLQDKDPHEYSYRTAIYRDLIEKWRPPYSSKKAHVRI